MSKYNDESVFVDEQIPDSNIALNEENPSYFNIEIKGMSQCDNLNNSIDIKGNFQHDKFKQKTEQDSINKHIKKLNNNSLDLSNLWVTFHLDFINN